MTAGVRKTKRAVFHARQVDIDRIRTRQRKIPDASEFNGIQCKQGV